MTTVESQVRAMTKAERRTYLLEHGWTRLSGHGSECWFHPTHEESGGDRGFYTLAAAIRTALRADMQPGTGLRPAHIHSATRGEAGPQEVERNLNDE